MLFDIGRSASSWLCIAPWAKYSDTAGQSLTPPTLCLIFFCPCRRTVLRLPNYFYCSTTTLMEYLRCRFSFYQYRTNISSQISHTGSLSERIPALWLAGEHPQHALVQRGRRHGEPVPQRPVPPAGNVSRTKAGQSVWRHSRPAGGEKKPSELTFKPLLQAFSDYQIQQMTANFVDQFGFNDEEFSEHDENIK